ncbi:hypothetical protein [Amycolatopsis vastitatis]|uniref:Uncharacterized protein n=1 Tax=Amycolatopsis vastitatis TaxID=1905142 RepID=A0A229SSP1_9PSEU|nr:hypothetical protein [Amycolatopsis vastitatis]OXM61903.1 hypothetical protein CF165_36770 [Amycolatopsis vastitatis]
MREPTMTAARLDELLAEAGTEPCALAREALAAGTPAEFQNGTQPLVPMRSLFSRRENRSRRSGQGSVGFEAALRALGTYPGASLARATIDDRQRDRYFFELFLTPDLTRVVACFGVARPSRDGVRHPDGIGRASAGTQNSCRSSRPPRPRRIWPRRWNGLGGIRAPATSW